MSVHVTMASDGGAPVLALRGLAEDGLLARLARGVEAVAGDAQGPLVVDLRELAFASLEGARAFLGRLANGPAGGRLLLVGGPGPEGRDDRDAPAGHVAWCDSNTNDREPTRT